MACLPMVYEEVEETASLPAPAALREPTTGLSSVTLEA
jgi:hypothetical protein